MLGPGLGKVEDGIFWCFTRSQSVMVSLTLETSSAPAWGWQERPHSTVFPSLLVSAASGILEDAGRERGGPG